MVKNLVIVKFKYLTFGCGKSFDTAMLIHRHMVYSEKLRDIIALGKGEVHYTK